MKLAIAGTGMIIPDALDAIVRIENIELNAIWGRPHSRDKAKKFAVQYDISEVYTDYEVMLKNADIDSVYIGLINTVHYDYAKKALEHDKNVILEKPFTVSFDEAEKLFSLAREKGVFLFEAITAVHNPTFEKMKEYLPRIGDVRMVHANFSQYSSRYDEYMAGKVSSSFDPECMGGSLRDLNIYNIHIVAALFGVPKNVRYYPNFGHNGIDISGVLVMDYGDFKAVCSAAKDSDSPSHVTIQAEKGYIKIDSKANDPDNLTVSIRTEPDKSISYTEGAHHRMTAEFNDFERIINSRDYESAAYFENETLEVMRIVQNISAEG